MIDIIFCMDTTGSMHNYIKKSIEAVKKIVNDTSNLPNKKPRSILFGFVAYKDHPPQDKSYITKVQPLTDATNVLDFIRNLTASGGGDGPEAVLDGLFDSINKTNLRENSLKYIFHIGDAPPHGREFTADKTDAWPEGCPCKLKLEDLAELMK